VREKKGFTLIELLVVIAIISLLMSIIVPSLRMAKRKAAMAGCLTHVKQISTAWFMYKEEAKDKIPGADPGQPYAWVRHPRDLSGATLSAITTAPPVTDEDDVRGIDAGVLFAYLKSPDVFRCPMDRRKSLFDGSDIYRSFSMPQCLNYAPDRDDLPQIKQYNQIRSPGTKFMLLEEAEIRNYNLGACSFGAPEYTGGGELLWWDPLAVTHGDSSTLGYCDGHAENHKWVDSFTKERPETLARTSPPATSYGTAAPPAGQITDIEFMYAGWAYRYKK